jgi:hypothetical protein
MSEATGFRLSQTAHTCPCGKLAIAKNTGGWVCKDCLKIESSNARWEARRRVQKLLSIAEAVEPYGLHDTR